MQPALSSHGLPLLVAKATSAMMGSQQLLENHCIAYDNGYRDWFPNDLETDELPLATGSLDS
jgi:hypothetical protein